jgi:hypothetical protein
MAVQGKMIVSEAEGLVPPEILGLIDNLSDQLNTQVRFSNQAQARAVMNQLGQMVEPLSVFVILAIARITAKDPDFARKAGFEKADRLANAVANADRCKRNRDAEGLVRVVSDEIMPLLDTIIRGGGGTGAPDLKQFLLRGSK